MERTAAGFKRLAAVSLGGELSTDFGSGLNGLQTGLRSDVGAGFPRPRGLGRMNAGLKPLLRTWKPLRG